MRKMTQALGVIGACIFVLCGNIVQADWPQWRGVNRDAKLTDPIIWPKQFKHKWKVLVGEGVATPALVGDKLYVFSRQDGNEITRCLTAADGKELWAEKYESVGATGPAASFSGPRCSPEVADGKVVTIGVRGVISCLDAANGKKLWRKDDFQGSVPQFYTASSPIITDGLVLAQLGGRNNGAVVAYEVATGAQKWKCSGDSPAYASPVLMTIGGTKLVIAMTERKIVAINIANGQHVWETPFEAQGIAYNAATPIVDGQTLIYSGGGRGTTAVKMASEADKFTATEFWSNTDKSVQFNTPVVRTGLIYGLSQANELFCINEQTGQTAWSVPVVTAGAEGEPGGAGSGRREGGRGGYGSIIDAGSVLMLLTPNSELIVFLPGDKEFYEQAKIRVANSPTYAYPVVSGERLFVKDQDSVTLWTIERAALKIQLKP